MIGCIPAIRSMDIQTISAIQEPLTADEYLQSQALKDAIFAVSVDIQRFLAQAVGKEEDPYAGLENLVDLSELEALDSPIITPSKITKKAQKRSKTKKPSQTSSPKKSTYIDLTKSGDDIEPLVDLEVLDAPSTKSNNRKPIPPPPPKPYMFEGLKDLSDAQYSIFHEVTGFEVLRGFRIDDDPLQDPIEFFSPAPRKKAPKPKKKPRTSARLKRKSRSTSTIPKELVSTTPEPEVKEPEKKRPKKSKTEPVIFCNRFGAPSPVLMKKIMNWEDDSDEYTLPVKPPKKPAKKTTRKPTKKKRRKKKKKATPTPKPMTTAVKRPLKKRKAKVSTPKPQVTIDLTIPKPGPVTTKPKTNQSVFPIPIFSSPKATKPTTQAAKPTPTLTPPTVVKPKRVRKDTYVTPSTKELNKMLLRAVRANKCTLEDIDDLIDDGADVNTRDIHGNTPLMCAAQKGRLEIAQYLIKKGADVNDMNKKGISAIIHASSKGHADFVSLLLEYGAYQDTQDLSTQNTPLLCAAENDHLETCRVLLVYNANVNAISKKGMSSLMWAAKNGNSELCKLLLEQKADVTKVTATKKQAKGYTALHWAAQYNNADICEQLITVEAPLNTTSLSGYTPLQVAAKHNCLAAGIILLTHGAEAKGTINCSGKYKGATALIWTCKNGNLAFTQLLLDRGANMHVKLLSREAKDWTALVCAAEQNHLEVCKLLLLHAHLERTEEEVQTAKKTIMTILCCFKKLCPALSSDMSNMIFEYPGLSQFIVTIFARKIHNNKVLPKRLQKFVNKLWDATTEDVATQMAKAQSVTKNDKLKIVLDKENLNQTMRAYLLSKITISEQ